MKKIFLLLTLIVIVVSCEDNQDEVIYNASNTNVLNGIVCDANEKPISGLYREYYENGNIKMEVESKDGLPDGNGKFYDENGKLLYQADFKKGKLNGAVTHYFPDGEVHNEMTYSEGLQDGEQKTYDVDGNLIVEIEYEHGKPVKGYILRNSQKIELNEDELVEID